MSLTTITLISSHTNVHFQCIAFCMSSTMQWPWPHYLHHPYSFQLLPSLYGTDLSNDQVTLQLNIRKTFEKKHSFFFTCNELEATRNWYDLDLDNRMSQYCLTGSSQQVHVDCDISKFFSGASNGCLEHNSSMQCCRELFINVTLTLGWYIGHHYIGQSIMLIW